MPHPCCLVPVILCSLLAGQALIIIGFLACIGGELDLAGIGSRFADPVDLQNTWVAGRSRGIFGAAQTAAPAPVIVTVTLASGERISGSLVRQDDFYVSLRTDDGAHRSFLRRGDVPDVQIDDPLWRHYELLGELSDDLMHDVTAFLETNK